MADLCAQLMRSAQFQVVHRIFVERFDTERAAKRDHPLPRFNVAHTAPLIDGFTADDAEMIPICYVSIF